MILNAILVFWTTIISAVFSILPTATIASIPWVGTTIATVLSRMVSVWYAFLQTFPYANFSFEIFLLAFLPFEIGMLVLKFFLGNRVPSASH